MEKIKYDKVIKELKELSTYNSNDFDCLESKIIFDLVMKEFNTLIKWSGIEYDEIERIFETIYQTDMFKCAVCGELLFSVYDECLCTNCDKMICRDCESRHEIHDNDGNYHCCRYCKDSYVCPC